MVREYEALPLGTIPLVEGVRLTPEAHNSQQPQLSVVMCDINWDLLFLDAQVDRRLLTNEEKYYLSGLLMANTIARRTYDVLKDSKQHERSVIAAMIISELEELIADVLVGDFVVPKVVETGW